jgi:hypothetical protein
MSRIIHFNQMDVEVEQNFIGEWQAWEEGSYDCDCDQDGFFPTCTMGYGSTMMEAIVDLREQLEESENV